MPRQTMRGNDGVGCDCGRAGVGMHQKAGAPWRVACVEGEFGRGSSGACEVGYVCTAPLHRRAGEAPSGEAQPIS